jgi:hypothetical protein
VLNLKRKRDVKASRKHAAEGAPGKASWLATLKERACGDKQEAILAFERQLHKHSLLQLVKFGVLGDINSMDLTQGCNGWRPQLGPIRKLGQLFIDTMTLTYNNEHLRRLLQAKRSRAALARRDVVLTRKEETNLAMRSIKQMLQR